ncbi:hypothetical protein LIER_27321 [Lithospermum erythrorhizon]|uniref:Uncharacterized protein n=1 Tax=Lithospermum erythrorhizon TaxID=34254 RepID=A0AAV3REW7_LITER
MSGGLNVGCEALGWGDARRNMGGEMCGVWSGGWDGVMCGNKYGMLRGMSGGWCLGGEDREMSGDRGLRGGMSGRVFVDVALGRRGGGRRVQAGGRNHPQGMAADARPHLPAIRAAGNEERRR